MVVSEFRAKKIKKIFKKGKWENVTTDEWVYGFYFAETEAIDIPGCHQWVTRHYILPSSPLSFRYRAIEVDPETLSRFVGITE